MILKKWSLALVALALVAPLSASALGISITNVTTTSGSATVLDNGDVVTFDLVLENDANLEVFALGVGVYGYDQGAPGDTFDNNLLFIGGANADNVFSTAFFGGESFGGIDGIGDVFEDGAPFPLSQPRQVQLFDGISTTPATGNGSLDAGYDGTQIAAGGVHFQVSFAARDLGVASPLNPVQITLEFGTGQFGNAAIGDGGVVLPFTNDSYTLTIVPEPGTALLMGLGLAGLAATRRR